MDLGKVGKVVKAVETAAPKLADVAKDSMDWATQANKRTKAHETYFSRIEDLRNEIADVEDTLSEGFGNTADFEKLRGMYRSDLSKMAKNLEIPQALKTNLSEDVHFLDQASPGEADFSIHNVLSDYHNKIAKLPPNEKKQFDYLVDTADKHNKLQKNKLFLDANNRMDYASGILPHLRKLDPTQQDTFLKLLPDWEGSLDELQVAARTL